MKQTHALAKLKRLLGPKVGYRTNPKALTADDRATIRAGLADLQRAERDTRAARDARLAELLAGDARYQELKVQAAAASEAAATALGKLHHYRITVGVQGAMFFSVVAEGDNWDEVVRLVSEKKEAA